MSGMRCAIHWSHELTTMTAQNTHWSCHKKVYAVCSRLLSSHHQQQPPLGQMWCFTLIKFCNILAWQPQMLQLSTHGLAENKHSLRSSMYEYLKQGSACQIMLLLSLYPLSPLARSSKPPSQDQYTQALHG